MNIGLLVSGALGLKALEQVNSLYDLKSVCTDRDSTAIIEYCKINEIPLFVGNPRNGRAQQFIDSITLDVLLSVNYLFIVEKDLILWPRRLAINVHGSLLPKYRGRTPHVWAIINNEQETGITAHLIDEGCDTGDILDQLVIPIAPSDTGADLLAKYHLHYPKIIEKVLNQVELGLEKPIPQDETKATYFGKRTPADGLISWCWQKERIYNWIRAQAAPYPGAFTYYENQKITIHKIAYTEYGFIDKVPNGTIIYLNEGKPVVKTPNGAIVLLDYIVGSPVHFEVGKMFHN
jgi:methionyl-tRNA formyltransferase